jgi:hypothetical protein
MKYAIFQKPRHDGYKPLYNELSLEELQFLLALEELKDTESKKMILQSIESKLECMLKLEGALQAILEKLDNEDDLHLQKIVIEKCALNIKTWENLKSSLASLVSLKMISSLQIELINILNPRLSKLRGPDKECKETILEMLKDPTLHNIINAAFKEPKESSLSKRASFLPRFFSQSKLKAFFLLHRGFHGEDTPLLRDFQGEAKGQAEGQDNRGFCP